MRTSKLSRTPRASTKSVVTRLPPSKKKSQPNASILNYFKKPSDEHMFICEGQGSPEVEEEEQDIYGLDEPLASEEPRYNESEASVKKRRLSWRSSPPPEEPSIRPEPKVTPLFSRKQPTKVSNNPFLDDSSDEEEPSTPGTCVRYSGDNGVKDGEGIVLLGSRPDLGLGRSIAADENGIARQPFLQKESSANSDLIKNTAKVGDRPSTNGDFGEFADLDMDEFAEYDPDGEEFREMQYMEEQARLEAEEARSYSCDDGFPQPAMEDAVAESCPICNGSLAGVTPDQATAHVNACLDGNPTPLPTPSRQAKIESDNEVDAPQISKRFARAAIPRRGQPNPISLENDKGSGKGPSGSAFTKLMSGHAEDAAWTAAAAAEHASRGRPAYQRTCPFYKIMPGFFICVDAFRYGAVEGCRAYFLSHFHSDHYVGLTASWTHGPIYCSKVTGSLVKSQLRTTAKYVVELEFEEKTPVPGTEGVFVTMIPANHCPGSSLFLFEKATGGRTQRILHCGDFRACPAHVKHDQLRPHRIDAITGKTLQQKIDVCYLDTTYLNPRYSFPPQDDVIQACADLCVSLDQALESGDDSAWDAILRRRGGAATGIDSVSKFFTSDKKPHADNASAAVTGDRNNPNSDSPASRGAAAPLNAFTALTRQPSPPRRPRLLVVCGTYSIGKERICKAIAQSLGTKIFAPASKARVVAQLDDPELAALLTTDPAEAQVHMQMLAEIRAETLAEYLASHRPHFARVVGLRPSGWNYRPANSAGASASANLAPAGLPTAQLLHGAGWRARLAARDLVPQRGSTREAACFGVPYSEHSSFRELALFLMALRVERVVPTVNVGSEQSRRRMKGWIDRWLAERRKGGLVSVLGEGDEKGDGAGVALWEGKDGRGGGVYW